MNIIFFDLEGPLSPQDNAYNLMKLFEGGDRIFEIISRYDDLLTLDKKPGYEPGDTLALIAPFLLYHRITEQNIIDLAESASIVNGARELILYLIAQNWAVYCISTSYKQYAINITRRLDIPDPNVACTNFPIKQLLNNLKKTDFQILKKLESEILAKKSPDDIWIKTMLDQFYWKDIPQTNLINILNQVKPVGGQRKVEALYHFTNINNANLAECVVIGDSITDYKMLNTVKIAGGLSIAFNGNEFVLPYANVALASTNISNLKPLLNLWKSKNIGSVEKWIRMKERSFGRSKVGNFSWVADKKDLSKEIELHKKIRYLVREDAAKLG